MFLNESYIVIDSVEQSQRLELLLVMKLYQIF